MGDGAIDPELLHEVLRRAPTLGALSEESMDRRDLERHLDISKSTSHRHVRSLTDRRMVLKSDGEYSLTAYGHAVADVVASFEAAMDTTVRLAPVYDAVSGIEPPCPTEALADATVTSTDHGDPFAPLARFISLVRETDSLSMADSYAIAPTYIDEIHGRVLDGLETAVIERPEVAEEIMENYPRKCVELCASEFLTMTIHDDLPFGLAILDDRIGIGVRDPETGAPWTFVDTDASEASEWAETVFESRWREAAPLEHFTPRALRETIEDATG